MKNLKVLISEYEIEKREEELAKEIMEKYNGENLVLLCILKGSVIFMSQLAKLIRGNNIEFEFIELSSYFGTESTGTIILNKDIKNSIKGKHVLIIEDIIDTGRTIKYLKKHLEEKEPKNIEVCTLLDKPSRRVVEINAEYVGFEIEDKFVVGYGLDYNEKYRNLPYIGYFE